MVHTHTKHTKPQMQKAAKKKKHSQKAPSLTRSVVVVYSEVVVICLHRNYRFFFIYASKHTLTHSLCGGRLFDVYTMYRKPTKKSHLRLISGKVH